MKQHTIFPFRLLHWPLMVSGMLIIIGLVMPGVAFAASRTLASRHPVAPAITPPRHTVSIYEQTVSSSTLQQQGCKAAAGPAGLVVLDFGEPAYKNGTYGVGLFPNGTFASDDDVLHASANFVYGSWNCRSKNTNITLAIGTSNYNGQLGSDTSKWAAAGMDWGLVVISVQSYIVNSGYGGQFTAWGADDIEVASGWATYNETVNFVNNYNDHSPQTFVDYGDDPGGANPSPWTAQQLWYVASGATDDVALPEIYYNADATQDWEPLDQWACANEGGAMKIIGTMSEYPSGNSNRPGMAFKDMYNAMGASSCTANARGELVYSTNI